MSMTKCTKCSAELPDGSKFCNGCGAPQGPASPGAPAAPPPEPLAPPAAPVANLPPHDEPEQQLWKGSISPKSYAHWWILWAAWVVLLVYAFFASVSAEKRPEWLKWIFLGIMALPALALSWNILINRLSVRYRLTTHRFFKETGILSRKIAELELIRVDDIQAQQNLLQRIFNVGTVLIISTDATDPRLEIKGIEHPIEVKEQIRTHVRKRRGKSLHVESL